MTRPAGRKTGTRLENATHKACARNIMLFNKEVMKEARLVENAAHILMSMKSKSKSKPKHN